MLNGLRNILPIMKRVSRAKQDSNHLSVAWIIPGLTSLLVGFFCWFSSRWDLLGVPVGDRHFGDLRVVTTASECAGLDPSWSIASIPCEPLVAIYNYPSIWAQTLGRFSVNASHTELIAALFIIIFSISLAYLSYATQRRGASWVALTVLTICGISPAALLAFERGNIDVLVYGIVVLGLALAAQGAMRTSGLTLGLATGLKLFPIGSVCSLLIDRPIKKLPLLAFSLVGGIGLILALRDLPLISSRTPLLDGAAFGAAELPLLISNRLGLGFSPNVTRAVGLLLLLVTVAVLALVLRKMPNRFLDHAAHSTVARLRADRTASLFVLGGGGAFTIAYIAGPSFDYRLIFLIPCIAGFLRLNSKHGNACALLLTVQLILSYSTFVGAAQYISDGMLLLILPALLLLLGAVVVRGVTPNSDSKIA
jgi:hypothetical protein